MAPPPELNDDVTAEILLRVAPDEPASLFRASVVCKLWHRIVSDPDFCRRYRAFHRGAPLLGFFYNLDLVPRLFPDFSFVASTAASPLPRSAAAHDDRRVSWALDCRHGRVLFQKADRHSFLAVWDPIADVWTDLPPLGIWYRTFTAVVLCDVAGCDHRDCRGGRFLVVCIGRDHMSTTVYACVYSSEDRAWRAPVSDGTQCRCFHVKRPALIGDAIYCTGGGDDHVDTCILKYDLVEHRFSSIDMPHLCRSDLVLTQNEDGSLGVASMRSSRLYLWSRGWSNNNQEEGDAAGWVQRRVIKLWKLLPVAKHCIKASVIGFAEGVGVFIIKTNAGVFTLQLKSRRVMKVMSNPSKNFHSVVPFTSFFTPDHASRRVPNSQIHQVQ